jgi:hypothetical protein
MNAGIASVGIDGGAPDALPLLLPPLLPLLLLLLLPPLLPLLLPPLLLPPPLPLPLLLLLAARPTPLICVHFVVTSIALHGGAVREFGNAAMALARAGETLWLWRTKAEGGVGLSVEGGRGTRRRSVRRRSWPGARPRNAAGCEWT